MAQVWNLPGPARPGYLQCLGPAALFLGGLRLGVIVTTLLTSWSAYGHNVIAIAVLLEALAVAANIGMYLIGFRVLTSQPGHAGAAGEHPGLDGHRQAAGVQ